MVIYNPAPTAVKRLFVEVEYAIPEALTRGKDRIRVRFEPEPDRTAGPAFGVRLLAE